MVEIKGITKRYRNFFLDAAALSVGAGSYFVLLGPTGSGKSLILNMVAGVTKPDAGKIFFNRNDITAHPPERRNFGVVYQDSALFPHMGVEANIGFSLSVRGIVNSEVKKSVSEIMERLGIEYLAGRGVKNLSGGEKQRVALARALIMKPALLLLDEPFSALDSMTRIEMIDLMRDIKKEMAPTVIHITHDFEEAMSLGDSCAVINRGRVVESGTVSDVFSRPKDAFTANFTGARNVYSGAVVGSGDDTCFETSAGVKFFIGRRIEIAARNAVVSPDDVILSKKISETSARNSFPGKIIRVTRRSGAVEVRADIGVQMVSRVTSRSLEELGISEGDDITVIFKGNAVHLF